MLALPSNIGTRADNKFALLPELGVTLNCQLTESWTLTCGYSFLYLTEVARTGAQIDLGRTPPPFPNSNAPHGDQPCPEPFIDSTGLWVQGLNVGGVLKF